MNRYKLVAGRPARLSVSQLETRDNPVSTFGVSGAAAGGLPVVDVFRPDGTTLTRFQAFDSAFRGGVRADAGEIDGNPNTLEVVVGAGPGGGPHVKVFSIDLNNNNAVSEIVSFFPFDPSFTGGVRVAAGRFDPGSGVQQIVVGADAGGGPRVSVFRAAGSTGVEVGGPLGNFFGFEGTLRGGVRVAAGELDGDPTDGDELVVAAGTGGGPRVRVLRSDGVELASYFAFPSDFLGGVNVDTESTGGTTDRVRVDAGTDDFSQRSSALNQFAADAVRPAVPLNTNTTVFNTANVANGTNANTNGTFFTDANGNRINTGNGTTFIDANGNLVTANTGTAFTTGNGSAFTSGNNTAFTTSTPAFGTGLSTGFFPTFGTTSTGFGTNGFGSTGFGPTGFGSTGFGSTATGSTALGGTNFTTTGGTGISTLTAFPTTAALSTFGTFGDPGVLNPFPTLLTPTFSGTTFVTVPSTTGPIVVRV